MKLTIELSADELQKLISLGLHKQTPIGETATQLLRDAIAAAEPPKRRKPKPGRGGLEPHA